MGSVVSIQVDSFIVYCSSNYFSRLRRCDKYMHSLLVPVADLDCLFLYVAFTYVVYLAVIYIF